MVVETPENPQGYQRLEIRSYNGRLLRALTTPGADDSDVSPAVAISDDAVYFVREHWRNEGDGDSTMNSTSLMRVSLSAPVTLQAITLPNGIYFRSVSATADGAVLAGQCVDGGNRGPLSACVLNTRSDQVYSIGPQIDATIDDVTVSPDGHRIAFDDVLSNPYGTSEIYVLDLASRATTMITTLPGQNVSPAWVPDQSTCFAFQHFTELDGDSILLACANLPGLTAQVLPIGELPEWLSTQ